MSTPEAIVQEIQLRSKQREAIRVLWNELLPPQYCPDEMQLNVWLTRYPFDFVVRGIEKTADKRHKITRQKPEMDMTPDYMVRYASGVMVQMKQDAERAVCRG